MSDQYRCNRCSKEFETDAELNRHNQQEHQAQAGGGAA